MEYEVLAKIGGIWLHVQTAVSVKYGPKMLRFCPKRTSVNGPQLSKQCSKYNFLAAIQKNLFLMPCQ